MNISAKSFKCIFALLYVSVLVSACSSGEDETDPGAILMTCNAPWWSMAPVTPASIHRQ